jgi:hypothetical protein
MAKSNSAVLKGATATERNLRYSAPHVPSIGGKMFRRTSESAGRIS